VEIVFPHYRYHRLFIAPQNSQICVVRRIIRRYLFIITNEFKAFDDSSSVWIKQQKQRRGGNDIENWKEIFGLNRTWKSINCQIACPFSFSFTHFFNEYNLLYKMSIFISFMPINKTKDNPCFSLLTEFPIIKYNLRSPDFSHNWTKYKFAFVIL
jgi:hypothetical protein